MRGTIMNAPGDEFGATEIVADRGDAGIARIKELTDGIGADGVLECVGTGESMLQALRSTSPGGMVGTVGAPHGVEVPIDDLFWPNLGLRGGPAPVRRYLPDLLDRVWNRQIEPGKVFDLEPTGTGRRRLPDHGRTPRHQNAAVAVNRHH